MAINCAALGSEVSAIASTYNSLNSQWGTTLSSGLNAAQTDQVGVATSALNQLINTRDKISDLEDQLDFLLDEAEEGNCADVITYGDEYSFRLFQTREAISAGISNLRAAIKTSNDRLAASQKATTSKSNPGTGTPGTAEPDEEFLDEDAEIIDDEPLPEVDDFVDGTGLTEPPIGDEDDFLGGDGDTDDFLGIDGDTDDIEDDIVSAIHNITGFRRRVKSYKWSEVVD